MSTHQCFILAAGPHRYTGAPCSLWDFNNGKSILDWQVGSFKQSLTDAQVRVVVGYHFEEIVVKFPHLHFTHALNWENSNALQSFLEAPHDPSSAVIAMYGDTVFYPETLSAVAKIEADVVIAVDSLWRSRFQGRSQADLDIAETLNISPYGQVEYTGLIKLSPKALEWVKRHQAAGHVEQSFLGLVSALQKAKFTFATYDVAGCWAEMNEPNDLVHFILGTKAETLRRIRPVVQKSLICDQYTCAYADWNKNQSQTVDHIVVKFKGSRLVIRSSTSEEDSWETANAGVFDSVLNVDGRDTETIIKAINDVFASYGRPSDQAQVLVQPFISNTVMSGVLFTSDLVTGAPYYVINYDDASGSTDTVTSGKESELRTVIIFRQNVQHVRKIDPSLEAVIVAAQELENVLGYNKLDIEFAIDQAGKVYTFQVRPIVVKHDQFQLDDKQLSLFVKTAQDQFERWQKKPPHILGDSTVFSSMTDWNPAEIIGKSPNPLANSMYRYLITDEVWAQQRSEFGYRDVRPAPLVYSFCAQPYVDCRATLNSFIPADVPDEVAERLVNVYLDILRENHHFHDKMELDVVFTIWVPTFWEDVKTRFENRQVSTDDIKVLEKALKKLTAQALERLKSDVAPIGVLEKRFQNLRSSDLSSIEKAYQLIEDCRRYGTLAFAHAARAGFIAVALLKSLVSQGILTQERMLEFQGSVSTVAGDFQRDLVSDDVPLEELILRYGHLRPGTYDVNQKAYWEDSEFYFKKKAEAQPAHANREAFVFSEKEVAGLKTILDQLPTKLTVNDLIDYFAQAIQEREKVKFIFSRNISAALDELILYGADAFGLSREDIGFFTVDDIGALRTGSLDSYMVQELLRLRKSDILRKQLVKLPYFISSQDDFLGFEQEKSVANFITQLSAVAELAFIGKEQEVDINKKIVAIPNADPGFDWLFSHDIAGLITQYGGANSHMAIRCAELGLPAAIGVGDKIYEQLKGGPVLLDCLRGRIEHV